MVWFDYLKVWKWPEYAMTWLRGYQELKEARAKRLKAEAERQIAEAQLETYKRQDPLRAEKEKVEDFELRVGRMVRAIREKHSRAIDAKTGIEEDDPEVKREAIRRITEEDWKKS